MTVRTLDDYDAENDKIKELVSDLYNEAVPRLQKTLKARADDQPPLPSSIRNDVIVFKRALTASTVNARVIYPDTIKPVEEKRVSHPSTMHHVHEALTAVAHAIDVFEDELHEHYRGRDRYVLKRNSYQTAVRKINDQLGEIAAVFVKEYTIPEEQLSTELQGRLPWNEKGYGHGYD